MSLSFAVVMREQTVAQRAAPPLEFCEEVVLAAERDGADGAFDGVGVEFDAAVIKEAARAAPAGRGIADGIGQAAARWDVGKLGL
jgi:hypothetical protein